MKERQSDRVKAAVRPYALALGILVLLGAAPVEARTQRHAGQYEQVDIEYGAQIFAERCVVCHGERGDLMPQANLRNGVFRNATSDRELSRVIAEGVPGTAMVATGYSGTELTALVAYLRNITTFDASGTMIGDPERGTVLFDGAGDCTCHRVGGSGPRYAPDLTSIGSIRTPATLQRTLADPDAALLPINRTVTAVTADGEVVRGRRLNEDTFNVQLLTVDERLVTFEKPTLRDYSISTESAMPSYSEQFSEQEIADLVAYLLTLKGLDR
jgi:putative heme-binding domain-containing protein